MWVWLILFIHFIFLILLIRQTIKAALALWTGYLSDVPFHQTNHQVVQAIVSEIKSIESEREGAAKFLELGSGDGRLSLAIARETQAAVRGVELNWPLYTISKLKAWILKLLGHNSPLFYHQNLFDVDLSQADIVYMYLVTPVMKRLSSKLEEQLKPRALLISWKFPFNHHSFQLIEKIEFSEGNLHFYQRSS